MTDAPDEPFTVWITKYALTLGIYKGEAYRRKGKPVGAIVLKKEFCNA